MVMRFILPVIVAGVVLGCSCSSPTTPNSEPVTATPKVQGGETAIGTTGYSIVLLDGYKIENQVGGSFDVYYFKPIDTTLGESEAGIYFGPRPDTAAPSIDYTKKLFPGTFMGNAVTWTEYTTVKYTQREVFIDQGPDKKIHCWCYSQDPAVLENLWEMVKTIK
jgi:hypothetical protein